MLPQTEDEGPTVTTTIRVPERLLAEIDAIAKEKGQSRTWVFVNFLRYARDEYRKEQAEPPPPVKPKR